LTLAERLRAQAEKNNSKIAAEALIPTVKHIINTQDLVKEAEIVARNFKSTIPDTIFKVVERAIRARKRCAAWFEETGIDNGHSTEGYLYFVGVLEDVLKILNLESTKMEQRA
jgi:hypothetical protein